MKKSHRDILNKIEKYLKQPGAEQLRFWQALYGINIIRGELKVKQGNFWDAPDIITVIKDDFNISDESLLKQMK